MTRILERSSLSLAAHIRSVKTRLDLSLTDISPTGCRVAGVFDNIAPGEFITIRPDGLGEFGAAVIWIGGGEAGLEFDFPMHPEVVACLSRIYPPNGRTLRAELAA